MARRRMPKPAGYHWTHKRPIVRPDGLKPCRWCLGPVAPPRRSWCSEDCIREWTRRTSWSLTRLAVFERDKGRCAACGVDAEAVLARFRQAVCDRMGFDRARASLDAVAVVKTVRASRRRYRTTVTKPEPLPADLIALFAARAGWPESAFRPKAHAWEADHIIPVADGGDFFDLGNIRTMCIRCHREVTTAQNRARAADRRARRAAGA
jgi:5-methylcytosine-specific restriction protein A